MNSQVFLDSCLFFLFYFIVVLGGIRIFFRLPLLLLQYLSCNPSAGLSIGKGLFVSLIDKIDDYFHHHILLLRLTLGNHQG